MLLYTGTENKSILILSKPSGSYSLKTKCLSFCLAKITRTGLLGFSYYVTFLCFYKVVFKANHQLFIMSTQCQF